MWCWTEKKIIVEEHESTSSSSSSSRTNNNNKNGRCIKSIQVYNRIEDPFVLAVIERVQRALHGMVENKKKKPNPPFTQSWMHARLNAFFLLHAHLLTHTYKSMFELSCSRWNEIILIEKKKSNNQDDWVQWWIRSYYMHASSSAPFIVCPHQCVLQHPLHLWMPDVRCVL